MYSCLQCQMAQMTIFLHFEMCHTCVNIYLLYIYSHIPTCYVLGRIWNIYLNLTLPKCSSFIFNVLLYFFEFCIYPCPIDRLKSIHSLSPQPPLWSKHCSQAIEITSLNQSLKFGLMLPRFHFCSMLGGEGMCTTLQIYVPHKVSNKQILHMYWYYLGP